MALLTALTTFLSSTLNVPFKPTDVAALLVVLCVFLLFIVLSTLLLSLKAQQERRRRLGLRLDTPPSTLRLLGVKLLTILGLWARPRREDEISKIRLTLLRAGYRKRDALILFFGIKFVLTLFLPTLFAVLRPPALRQLSYPTLALIIIFLAMAGFYAPSLWVRLRTRSRRQKIANGFPDALDLMVVCVEAGLGLEAAIHRVGKEIALSHPLLSEEFDLVDAGLRRGQARETALRQLGMRTNLEDVTSFVTLIIQTIRFGASIAQALKVLAASMRTKRQQRAEKIAAQLPVKLLFPLVFCIFPFFFVIILGPPVIQLIKVFSSMASR